MTIDKRRQHYETLFASYPDVVDTEAVRIMLGGVSNKTVFKLFGKGI